MNDPYDSSGGSVQQTPPWFQALYDAPHPVVVAREDGRFLLINRAFQTAVGFTPQEIPTFSHWLDRMGGEDPERLAAYLERLFSRKSEAAQVRLALKDKSGRARV